MTIALTLFAAAVMIAGGYAAWLLVASRTSHAPDPLNEYPAVLIVVPVFDEARLIAGKLENLASLTYPAERRHILVVDGGSTDGTLELIEKSGFDQLRTQLRNKTEQINAALRLHADAKWIVITDADAILATDTIERLMAVAANDASVGVVGARVRPRGAHALESLHWRFADWLRERECDRGSAAIVTAPCYAAKRELIAELPADTLADDVHVACRALAAGRRVGRADSIVFELRSPRKITALLRHKFRKADAYLREIFRFLPHARRMPGTMRTIFLWRAALLTIVPLLCTIACGVAVAAAVDGIELTLSAAQAIAVATAAAMVLAAKSGRKAARLALLAALLTTVSAAALLRFPFSRQTASFPKIAQFDEAE